MNIGEWLKSKKTKDMLTTQLLIGAVLCVALIASKGDPEKAKSLVEAVEAGLLLMAGVGGTTIAAQAHVDGKLAANKK